MRNPLFASCSCSTPCTRRTCSLRMDFRRVARRAGGVSTSRNVGEELTSSSSRQEADRARYRLQSATVKGIRALRRAWTEEEAAVVSAFERRAKAKADYRRLRRARRGRVSAGTRGGEEERRGIEEERGSQVTIVGEEGEGELEEEPTTSSGRLSEQTVLGEALDLFGGAGGHRTRLHWDDWPEDEEEWGAACLEGVEVEMEEEEEGWEVRGRAVLALRRARRSRGKRGGSPRRRAPRGSPPRAVEEARAPAAAEEGVGESGGPEELGPVEEVAPPCPVVSGVEAPSALLVEGGVGEGEVWRGEVGVEARTPLSDAAVGTEVPLCDVGVGAVVPLLDTAVGVEVPQADAAVGESLVWGLERGVGDGFIHRRNVGVGPDSPPTPGAPESTSPPLAVSLGVGDGDVFAPLAAPVPPPSLITAPLEAQTLEVVNRDRPQPPALRLPRPDVPRVVLSTGAMREAEEASRSPPSSDDSGDERALRDGRAVSWSAPRG